MKDFRKFCRPKLKTHLSAGDFLLRLKCGTTGAMSPKEYKKVKKFFKSDSFVGESSSSAGKVITTNKMTGDIAIFDIETYNLVKDLFEILEIVGEKLVDIANDHAAQEGDIICYNSKLDRETIFSYEDWITLDDSWDATGLYGITTIEEENTVGGEYVIMANGITFIINASDYSKVNSHWEHVDTITTILQHDYVEIGGVKWATMNVGAENITDYGLYFQWGDTQGYTASQVGSGEGQKAFGWADYKYGNGTSSPGAVGMTKYNSTDGKTVLDIEDDAARANMGGQWRMPTTEELQALGNAVNAVWTTNYNGSGVNGLLCTDKTDSSKTLFFPAAGLAYNGSMDSVGDGGNVWSSSLYSDGVYGAWSLGVYSGDIDWGYDRYYGFSVRGILDE